MVMTGMQRPQILHEARLHRVGRYLCSSPAVKWMYKYQSPPIPKYGLGDADHASDEETRKSVTCIQAFLGNHLIDQEVFRQQVTALSSGEAEFYSLGSCAAMVLLVCRVLDALG